MTLRVAPMLKNPRWERLAQLIAIGTNQTQAYAEAFAVPVSDSAKSNASRLLQHPDLVKRVAKLRGEITIEDTLTLRRKRQLLSQFAQADLSRPLDELLPICQSVKRSSRTTNNGDIVEDIEVKLPNKIEAIQLDARLAGELEGPDHGSCLGLIVNVTLQRMLIQPSDAQELPNSPEEAT